MRFVILVSVALASHNLATRNDNKTFPKKGKLFSTFPKTGKLFGIFPKRHKHQYHFGEGAEASAGNKMEETEADSGN